MEIKVTPEMLLRTMSAKGYPIYKGDLNLNIVGIRARDTASDTFNDLICLLYFNSYRNWKLYTYEASTDAGVYYRENPMNVLGTAVLKEGHYPKCWKLGRHRGAYKALVQCGDMTVYRDNDRDKDLDCINFETGRFGINLHKAGWRSRVVGKWSAGCQVIASVADYTYFLDIVTLSKHKYGNKFSYTLINEQDLDL